MFTTIVCFLPLLAQCDTVKWSDIATFRKYWCEDFFGTRHARYSVQYVFVRPNRFFERPTNHGRGIQKNVVNVLCDWRNTHAISIRLYRTDNNIIYLWATRERSSGDRCADDRYRYAFFFFLSNILVIHNTYSTLLPIIYSDILTRPFSVFRIG